MPECTGSRPCWPVLPLWEGRGLHSITGNQRRAVSLRPIKLYGVAVSPCRLLRAGEAKSCYVLQWDLHTKGVR